MKEQLAITIPPAVATNGRLNVKLDNSSRYVYYELRSKKPKDQEYQKILARGTEGTSKEPLYLEVAGDKLERGSLDVKVFKTVGVSTTEAENAHKEIIVVDTRVADKDEESGIKIEAEPIVFSGEQAKVTLKNTQAGIQYQLFFVYPDDSGPLSGSVVASGEAVAGGTGEEGNEGEIILECATIYRDEIKVVTFQIRATVNGQSDQYATLQNEAVVTVHPTNIGLTTTSDKRVISTGSATSVTLNESLKATEFYDIEYQLRDRNGDVASTNNNGGWVPGTGGAIEFTTRKLDNTTLSSANEGTILSAFARYTQKKPISAVPIEKRISQEIAMDVVNTNLEVSFPKVVSQGTNATIQLTGMQSGYEYRLTATWQVFSFSTGQVTVSNLQADLSSIIIVKSGENRYPISLKSGVDIKVHPTR